jgi:hypothetical protein
MLGKATFGPNQVQTVFELSNFISILGRAHLLASVVTGQWTPRASLHRFQLVGPAFVFGPPINASAVHRVSVTSATVSPA